MVSRLKTSVHKHGVLSTMGMAARLAAHAIPNIKDDLLLANEKRRTGTTLALKTIQGSPMILNLADAGIARELALTGIHEANSTKQLHQELRPGMTIVEVGANIGYYSLIEAKIIGGSGKIFALEPSPDNMRYLKANVHLNGLENTVETHLLAAGRKTGTQTLYIMDKGNTSSFVKRDEGSGLTRVAELDVDVVSLDEFFESRPDTIDYFRMDVEGYELEIIEGMRGILTGDHPPLGCFIEVHSVLLAELGSSSHHFVTNLCEMGYRVKTARYRGRDDIRVESEQELLAHPLLEKGYWETFFERRND